MDEVELDDLPFEAHHPVSHSSVTLSQAAFLILATNAAVSFLWWVSYPQPIESRDGILCRPTDFRHSFSAVARVQDDISAGDFETRASSDEVETQSGTDETSEISLSPSPSAFPSPSPTISPTPTAIPTTTDMLSANITSPSPAPAEPTRNCYHDSHGNGICWYTSPVCTDGKNTFIIDETAPEDMSAVAESRLHYNFVYHDLNGRMHSPDDRTVPLVPPFFTDVYRRKVPSTVEQVWHGPLVFINGPLNIANTFVYMESVIAPIIGVIRLLRENSIPTSFDNATLALINTMFMRTGPSPGMKPNAMTWLDSILTALMSEGGFSDLVTQRDMRYNKGIVENRNRWMCSRNAILAGSTTVPIQGRIEKQLFRDIICRSVGLECSETIGYGYTKVDAVLLNRRFIKDTGINDRRFDNLDEMTQILDKYSDTLSYQVYDPHFDTPFAEQVAIFSKTKLLIAAHGAGIINCLLMPDHSVVIEIFPYHIFMDAYQRMAATAGVIYMNLFSNNPGNRLTYCFSDCHDISDVSDKVVSCQSTARLDGNCWHEFIRGSVYTPLLEFDLAIYNAISNLNLLPQVRVPLLELQGVDQRRPAYPERAKDFMATFFYRRFDPHAWPPLDVIRAAMTALPANPASPEQLEEWWTAINSTFAFPDLVTPPAVADCASLVDTPRLSSSPSMSPSAVPSPPPAAPATTTDNVGSG